MSPVASAQRGGPSSGSARSRRVVTKVSFLAALLALGACAAPASPSPHADGTRAASSSLAVDKAVPAGDMRVNYGIASIVVPASWRTLLPGWATCVEAVVFLGSAAGSCGPAQPGRPTSFAHLQALPTAFPRGTSQTINGHTAVVLAPSDGSRTYVFPGLGVELKVAGSDAYRIAHSIGWSSRDMVLNDMAHVGIPPSWGTTIYEGVAVRLPRSWPLAKVGPAEGEPGCGADFFTPKLLEGPVFFHTCGLVSAEPPLVDGVWLQGGAGLNQAQATADGYTALSGTRTKVYFAQGQDPMGLLPFLHLLVVTGYGSLDALDVGLGPNPMVAAAIIASVTATSGSMDFTPNTTAPASQTGPVPTTSAVPAGARGATSPTAPATPSMPTTSDKGWRAASWPLWVPSTHYCVRRPGPSWAGSGAISALRASHRRWARARTS
jgi:hypothetical protein